MKCVLLALFVLSVVVVGTLAKPSRFLPTRNGGQTPEVFWYPNDNGVIVPALLHGKRPNVQSNKGIADDVQFFLYNSKNIAVKTDIAPGCSGCLGSFKVGAPVVILAHGFSSSSDGGFGEGLRSNLAKATEEMNLIFINWEKLAQAPWYETAADNTKPVGQYTAQLIEFLLNQGVATISDFSFAGHSLGSHIGNFIAHNLTSGLKLPKIHALDPALPLFGVRDDDERIDPTDADFVNVIHSSMGTLLDGGLAFTEPRGHADFYPNSGQHQPGCGVDAFGACSHSRAHEYWGESTHRTNAFVSCECDTWEHFQSGCQCTSQSLMGFATPPNTRGIFYLRTNPVSPYGIGA